MADHDLIRACQLTLQIKHENVIVQTHVTGQQEGCDYLIADLMTSSL